VSRRDAAWLGGLLLLTAVAYADILAGARVLYQQDLTAYHFPMKHIVREAVRSGEFPYWNPYYSAGQPLAANPEYELFYPPQWLVYFLPFAYAFQLHIVIHFFLAATGMFLLIRSFGVKAPAAAIGAAAFVFGGPYLSLSSKLPFLFSISWMPLVLLSVRRAIERPTLGRCFASAAAMAMQLIIGEPTIVLQTWALIAGYAIYRIVRKGAGVSSARWRSIALPVVVCGVLAALLAAVQVLPAIDFAGDTVRSRGLAYAAVADWSFPLSRLSELLLPSLFRHVTAADGQAAIRTMYAGRIVPFLFEIYAGALIVLLALAGVVARVRGRWIFAGATIASVIVALGDHTPLLRLLYAAHLATFVRYPEKFILTAAFILVVWSAIVLQKIFDGDRVVARRAVVLAGIWTAVSLLLLASPGDTAYFAVNAGRAALVLVALVLIAARRDAWRVALLCVVGIGDLWFSSRGAAPRMPGAFFDTPALDAQLDAVRGRRLFHDAAWSVWNDDPIAAEYFGDIAQDRFWWMLRNGEFWNLAAARNHALVLEPDIGATSLTNTDDFRMAFNLAHVRHSGADEPYLRMANAGGKISFKTLDDATRGAALRDPARFTPVAVEPLETTPRYAFASRIERITTPGELGAVLATASAATPIALADVQPFSPAPGEVLASKEGWNDVSLTVRTAGRAFLVASVTGHKYWQATIDARPSPLIPTNVAFQGLIVPPGSHTIELRYRNPLVVAGGAVTALTILLLAAFLLFTRRSLGAQNLFI
jgi:hypothetical protein